MDAEEDRYAKKTIKAGAEIGKDLLKQLLRQGAGAGLVHIAALEAAACALEDGKADQGVKFGCVSMFAHRVLEGKFLDAENHAEELCLICSKLKELFDL